MSIDPRLKRAIEISVENNNQNEVIAEKLIRWLEQMGEQHVDDDEMKEYLDNLYRVADANMDAG